MAEAKENQKLLEVKDLHVSFFTPAGEVKAVGGISYDLCGRRVWFRKEPGSVFHHGTAAVSR